MSAATSRPRVPAVGGTRTVPAPDDVARDYILLGLRLDQHVPGVVDGYFGPAELKARVDMEQFRAPARLAEDAAALRARLPDEISDPERRSWLDLQLVALETIALRAAGRQLPYLEEVGRCFAHVPDRRPPERFETAASELDALLPGTGALAERLERLDDGWTVRPERVESVVAALVARYRARAEARYGVPPGEELRVSLVRGQPWTGYNWYDGGYRSRVDLNLDLPMRLPALIGVVAHETYPGHHLEHASKELRLVEELGHIEASALLINTPECVISEGLAEVAKDLAVEPSEREDLLLELAPLAGVPVAADPARLREAARTDAAVAALRAILDEARLNAALLLHADGRSREEALQYLIEVGRFASETAAKRLQFIEHPLWRTYVFVYAEGKALVRRWLDAVPAADRDRRFARLLTEALTPPRLVADAAAEAPSD